MAQTSTLLHFLFRKNTAKLLLLLLFTCLAGFAHAQSVTIFKETIGNGVVGAGTISEYYNAKSFDNDNLNFSGTGWIYEFDQSDYGGASGLNNVLLEDGQTFQISGINTSNYGGLNLSFGILKTEEITPIVEYSTDGANWTQLLIASVDNYSWVVTGVTDDINGNKLPKATNLSIRFKSASNDPGFGLLYLDDIVLTGVNDSSEPVITNFSPKQGGEGTEVTIFGKNLQNTSTVHLGAFPTTILSVSADQVKIRVRSGSTNKFRLRTVDSKSVTTTEDFIFIRPQVTSFSNSEGTTTTEAKQGTRITLHGTDIGSTQTVVFGGGMSAKPLTTTSTSVVVVVPQGASTGKLTVLTSMYGQGTSSQILTILKPIITSLSRTSGRINDAVTINGSRLNIGTYKVYFSGVSAPVAAVVSSASADGTSLRVTVPVGAVDGPITVTTDEGSATSSAFDVLVPEIILGGTEYLTPFTTAAGTPSEAQYYTVAGVNLGGGITVYAPANFEISATGEDGTWLKNTDEPLFFSLGADGAVEPTYVHIRYNPAVTGTHSGNIVHESEGIVKLLQVSGNAIAPLPVELISFKAQKQQNAVLLTWVTASEKDNSHFDVEMTNDAKGEFKAVGKINSKATNSSVKTNYEFSHSGSFTGTRYYRLKQVDLDGTTSYSNVIAVEMAALVQEKVKVAPNPISPESKLLFPAAEAGKLNITVVNMSGSKVATKSADVEAGTNTIELGLSDKLPSGIYILTTEFNGKTEQVRLIKQ